MIVFRKELKHLIVHRSNIHMIVLFELILYVPVNNSSVISGCFLGLTSTKAEDKWSYSIFFLHVLWVPTRTVCFVCFVTLRPKSTAMVIAGRSVHLTTLFPGQA